MYYLNDLIKERFMLAKGMDVPEELRGVLDWEKIYGNKGPLIVEIGFGNAEFLADLAVKNPESNVLGIELSPVSIRKAGKLIDRFHLDNVRIMRLDARLVLKHYIRDSSVERVYINFPDPWPKKRHSKHRFISESTMEILLGKMNPGSKLFFVTDSKEYAEEAHEVFSLMKDLKSVFHPDWYVNSFPDYFSTKYEQKWKSMDREIFYQCYSCKT